MTKDALRDYLKKMGRVGGLTRAKNMSKAKRKAAARHAARARWAKPRPEPTP